MRAVDESAACHFGEGVLSKAKSEIEPCRHELSGCKITIYCPKGSAVERSVGSLGNGMNAGSPPKTISLAALLLVFDRLGIEVSLATLMACIVEAEGKGLTAAGLMPPIMTQALREVWEATPPEDRTPEKTKANRIGVAAAQVEIERLSVAAYGAETTRRMVRRT